MDRVFLIHPEGIFMPDRQIPGSMVSVRLPSIPMRRFLGEGARRSRLGILVFAVILVLTVTFTTSSFLGPTIGGEVEWRWLEDMTGYEIHRGDMHGHTSYSDGSGTPGEAFRYARDTADSDFLILTDHGEMMDTYQDYLANRGNMEWDDGARQADLADGDTFTALRSFEWSSGIHGHMNAWFAGNEYATSLDSPSGFNDGDLAPSLSEWYEWLASHPRTLAQFNHPYVGDQYQGFRYDRSIDEQVVAYELWNGKRGEVYLEDYHVALDEGWHVAATACQDTHTEDWTVSTSLRNRVLVDGYGRDSLHDAFSHRRFIASNDSTAVAVSTLDEHIFGSTLDRPSVMDGDHTLTLEVAAAEIPGDPFSGLSIITNGGTVLHSHSTSCTSCGDMIREDGNGTYLFKSLEISIDDPKADVFIDLDTIPTTPNGEIWLYVAVHQADGDVIVTAPWWIRV